MPSHVVQDCCSGHFGTVRALGEHVRCFQVGDAVIGVALNGSVSAAYGDDDPVVIVEREGHWSVCRVDANGASCWHEFRGSDRTNLWAALPGTALPGTALLGTDRLD